MQIHIAGPSAGFGGGGEGFGLDAALAVNPPAAAVGDAADLLHIDVDHVPGPARDDASGCSVGLAVRVDESAPVRPQRQQMPRHGAPTDCHALAAQLEGDPRP
jgi:hypothetical protein